MKSKDFEWLTDEFMLYCRSTQLREKPVQFISGHSLPAVSCIDTSSVTLLSFTMFTKNFNFLIIL